MEKFEYIGSRMLKRLLWVSAYIHRVWEYWAFLLSLAELEVSNLEGRGREFSSLVVLHCIDLFEPFADYVGLLRDINLDSRTLTVAFLNLSKSRIVASIVYSISLNSF